MSTVVKVENLSKKYLIGHRQEEPYLTFRDALYRNARVVGARLLHPFISSSNVPMATSSQTEEFWALKDVSFEIKRGDRVGIIGRNGAGKSTLLKILSRITVPTNGRVSIKGRVASLLEVGTGFHPELTGRENIFLNGAVLGMTRNEIKKKFDEIVAFAEVEKFLDTPVKRYSSGMYVRLAFAVAAHLEPEILIVDEVLAVGDVLFQKKCLGKMEEVGKEGRTVIFVSHNLGAVKTLCQRAILLKDGLLDTEGEIVKVFDRYLHFSEMESYTYGHLTWEDESSAPGGEDLTLCALKLVSENGQVSGVFPADQKIFLEIDYRVKKPLNGMRMGFHLLTQEGEIAFVTTDHIFQPGHLQPGFYKSKCTIPGGLLNARSYIVKIGAGIPGERVLLYPREFLNFTIEGNSNHGSFYTEKWPGVLCPKLHWQVSRL